MKSTRTKGTRPPGRDGLDGAARERTRQLMAANHGLKNEIAERKRSEALLDGQKRVLEMIASGAPLMESLAGLVHLVEGQTPGLLGCILLVDRTTGRFREGVAPSLPSDYLKEIVGLAIGPGTGSCGLAAWRKEPVVVRDISTDPVWKDFRDVALAHGLRACWSVPILSVQRDLLGTFAFYCRKPELPQPDHWRLVEMATHVASIAIGSDQSRAAMRESETKLKQAERIGKFGYWERDVVNDRISWPEETSRIFDLSACHGPISQSQLEELIHPDDRQVQRRALEDAVQKRKPYDVEYRIIRSDGKIRSVHVRDEIVCNGAGRPVRMFGTVQDITERKQAEELLKAQETEIRAIVEHSPDPIARFDRKMRQTYVNPALIRMMGGLKAKLSGRKVGSAVRKRGAKASAEEVEMERSLNKVFETGRPLDFESSWPLPEGRRKYAVHLEPEFDGHGSLSSVLFIGRDITERRRTEEALRQNGRELARIARLTMMAELTASIAHEVNQPLAAVVTNANAALRWLGMPAPNLDEARQAVERIASDGTRASEVIQRVRDLVKKNEPGKKRINLNELVEQTLLLMQPEFAAKNIQLKKELAPAPALVAADPVQVQQVLLNLVANAVESLSAVVERRRILVVTTSQGGPGAAQVVVRDNGMGINARERARLFEPFYTTKPGGLGMGLSISRSIVEAHGGRLWVTPNRGRGATFQFTLQAEDGNPL